VLLKGSLKNNNHQIDISALELDVYILKIGKQSIKFVKED
jgi:hypothetical protein